MWFGQGFGYHVDNTTGIATGNEAESIYAVMSGTHINEGRCTGTRIVSVRTACVMGTLRPAVPSWLSALTIATFFVVHAYHLTLKAEPTGLR